MSCGVCSNCAGRLKCNICDNCDSGDYRGCNTQQTFCSGSRMEGQLASAYIGAAGAPAIKRDDIIIKVLPQSKLNALIDYINRAAAYTGERPSQSITGGFPIAHEIRPFVYADKIQEIITKIISMNSSNNPGFTAVKDQVIYGDHFNKLMNEINTLLLHTGACESCISGCNVQCNTCNACDYCISCNTCQEDTNYSSYYAD